ncbi:hypothetical protein SCHPADRAFT_933112 [Schizopora paradoxa]|uniref:Uncharacterized protein n=1 Tax=Schizopora paradoxa TaxID=27342 RepID=A0A0H2RND1_9AGAM|nr:hypothetical protein SCHPADRAFT_933112 [Schizopora paradoxa]
MSTEVEQDPHGIREELANALSACEKNSGSFYSFQSLPDAPNPFISTDVHGVVGVPLSESEGKRLLRSAARGGSSTSKARGAARKSCSVAIDCSKMRILNPKFNDFLDKKVIPVLCEKLGIRRHEIHPKAVFEAMFACTKGSELVPCHCQNPEPDKTFGKVLIILPSGFTGGSLRLSREGSETYEAKLETESALSTTAVAWFNGVSVTSMPLLSGYRLVLSYNLVKTSASTIMPGLDGQWGAFNSVRRLLLRWKQVKKEDRSDIVPNVLYYFWDEEDTRILLKLAHLASELGVKLYRAKIKFTRAGSATEDADERHGSGDSDDDDDDDAGRDDGVEIDEICAEDFTIQKLVTLDGNLLDDAAGIPFDARETVPISVLDDFDEPDKQDWVSEWLDQYFYRSALVISPFMDFTQPKAIFNLICKGLQRKKVDYGECFDSAEEGALVDRLIKMRSLGKVSDADARRACLALHSHAVQFNRAKAWTGALSICPQGAVLDCIGVQGFAQAYKGFESKFFDAAESFLPADMDLVRVLRPMAEGFNDAKMKKWCQDTMLAFAAQQLRNGGANSITEVKENSPSRQRTKRRKLND